MRTDVIGRVRNTSLPASRPLLPVYEAVVNSVQAIEDGKQGGHISVRVIRVPTLSLDESPELGEIAAFEVIDDGVGFNKTPGCQAPNRGNDLIWGKRSGVPR